MSFNKKDQVFPAGSEPSNEHYVALAIANALRKDYGELGSAVKRISRRIGAHPRAIRNWYEARNTPSSMNLLLLAQSSPEVFQALLELLGRSDLLEADGTEIIKGQYGNETSKKDVPPEIYSEENFTINVTISPALRCKLNQRQLWYLGLLQQGQNIKAAQIASSWGVTIRTARTDISDLIEQRLVRFKGARKAGKYEIINQPAQSSSSPTV